MFRLLDPYKALLDVGPVQMSVIAERKGMPLGRGEWGKLEEMVSGWLADITRYRAMVQQPWTKITRLDAVAKVVQRMHSAVRSTQDVSLTPMAAVAGTIAGFICDYFVEHGATKVVVNNGGDIAVHLGKGETTRVGIAPRLGIPPSHYLDLKYGDRIGGIATSGLGGRSFTLGIADAAVVMATDPSVADACATVLGNAVNVESVLIKRRLAKEIDPATDIPDLWVTVAVGTLPNELKAIALERGVSKARQLVEQKLLTGAVIFVAGEMLQYPGNIVRSVNE